MSRKPWKLSKHLCLIVVDNSSSIIDLKSKNIVFRIVSKITQNKDLQDKFDIQSYRFDSEFQQSTAFDFKGTQTNLDEVAKSLKSIYKNTTFPNGFNHRWKPNFWK